MLHSATERVHNSQLLKSLSVVSSSNGAIVHALIFQYRSGASKVCGTIPQTASASSLRWHSVPLADNEYIDQIEFRAGTVPVAAPIEEAAENGEYAPLSMGDEVSVWWWEGSRPDAGWSETLHLDADILIGQNRGRWRPARVVASPDLKQPTKMRVEFKLETLASATTRRTPKRAEACVARSRVRRVVIDFSRCEFLVRTSTIGHRVALAAMQRYTRVFGGDGGRESDEQARARRFDLRPGTIVKMSSEAAFEIGLVDNGLAPLRSLAAMTSPWDDHLRSKTAVKLREWLAESNADGRDLVRKDGHAGEPLVVASTTRLRVERLVAHDARRTSSSEPESAMAYAEKVIALPLYTLNKESGGGSTAAAKTRTYIASETMDLHAANLAAAAAAGLLVPLGGIDRFEIESIAPVWEVDEIDAAELRAGVFASEDDGDDGGGGGGVSAAAANVLPAGRWVVRAKTGSLRKESQWTTARMQRKGTRLKLVSKQDDDSLLALQTEEQWRARLYASLHLAQVEYRSVERSAAAFDAEVQMISLAEETIDREMAATVTSMLSRLMGRAVYDACRRYPVAQLSHIDRSSSAFQLALHEVAGLPKLRAGQLREAIEVVMETLGPLSQTGVDSQATFVSGMDSSLPLLAAALGEIVIAAHNPVQAALLIARALEPSSSFIYATTPRTWELRQQFVDIATELCVTCGGDGTSFVGHFLAPSHFDIMAREEDDPWSIATQLEFAIVQKFLACPAMRLYAEQKWKGPLVDAHYVEWLVRQFRIMDKWSRSVLVRQTNAIAMLRLAEKERKARHERRATLVATASEADGEIEVSLSARGTRQAKRTVRELKQCVNTRTIDSCGFACDEMGQEYVIAKTWTSLRGGQQSMKCIRWVSGTARSCCAPVYAPFLCWQLPFMHYNFDLVIRIVMIVNHSWICLQGPYVDFSISHVILLILSGGFLFAELQQFSSINIAVYFRDVANVIDLSHGAIFFAAGILFSYIKGYLEIGTDEYLELSNYYFIMMIIAFIILLFRFLWVFELHPSLGPFVGVLMSMLRELVKFLGILGVISFTFSFAFFALYGIAPKERLKVCESFGEGDCAAWSDGENEMNWSVEHYEDIQKSIQQTIRMFFGEVSFDDFAGLPPPWDTVGELMLFVYILIGTLLLGNLFIAVVSEEYKPEEMEEKYHAKKARIVHEYAMRIRESRLPPPLNLVGGFCKGSVWFVTRLRFCIPQIQCNKCRRWRHAPGRPNESFTEYFSLSRKRLAQRDHQLFFWYRVFASTVCCPLFPTIGCCFSSRRRLCKLTISLAMPGRGDDDAEKYDAHLKDLKETLPFFGRKTESRKGKGVCERRYCRTWQLDFNRAFCWEQEEMNSLKKYVQSKLRTYKFHAKHHPCDPVRSKEDIVANSVLEWLTRQQSDGVDALHSSPQLLEAYVLDELSFDKEMLDGPVHKNRQSAGKRGRKRDRVRSLCWRLCGGRLSIGGLLDPYLTYINWKRRNALGSQGAFDGKQTVLAELLSLPASTYEFTSVKDRAQRELKSFDTAKRMIENEFHHNYMFKVMNLSVDRGFRALGFLMFLLIVRTPIVLLASVIVLVATVLAAALVVVVLFLVAIIAPFPLAVYFFVWSMRKGMSHAEGLHLSDEEREKHLVVNGGNSSRICCKTFMTSVLIAVLGVPVGVITLVLIAVVLTLGVVEYTVHQAFYLACIVVFGPIFIAVRWASRPFGCICKRYERSERRDEIKRIESRDGDSESIGVDGTRRENMEWGMDRVPEVFDFFQNVVSSEMATHDGGYHDHLQHHGVDVEYNDGDIWMLATTFCANERNPDVRSAVSHWNRGVVGESGSSLPSGDVEAEGDDGGGGAEESEEDDGTDSSNPGAALDVRFDPTVVDLSVAKGATTSSIHESGGGQQKKGVDRHTARQREKRKARIAHEAAVQYDDKMLFSTLQDRLELDEQNRRLDIDDSSFVKLRDCLVCEKQAMMKNNRKEVGDIVRVTLHGDDGVASDTLTLTEDSLISAIANLFTRPSMGVLERPLSVIPTSPGVESIALGTGASGESSDLDPSITALLTERMVLAFLRAQEIGDALVVKRLIDAGADVRALTRPYFLANRWTAMSWLVAMRESGFNSRFTMCSEDGHWSLPSTLRSCLGLRGGRGRKVQSDFGEERTAFLAQTFGCVEPPIKGWAWRTAEGPLGIREADDVDVVAAVARVKLEVYAQMRTLSPLAHIFAMGTMRYVHAGENTSASNALRGISANRASRASTFFKQLKRPEGKGKAQEVSSRGIPLESSTLYVLLSVVLAEMPDALQQPLCYFDFDPTTPLSLAHEHSSDLEGGGKTFAERVARIDAERWGLRERSRWASSAGILGWTHGQERELDPHVEDRITTDDAKWDLLAVVVAQFETSAAVERRAAPMHGDDDGDDADAGSACGGGGGGGGSDAGADEEANGEARAQADADADAARAKELLEARAAGETARLEAEALRVEEERVTNEARQVRLASIRAAHAEQKAATAAASSAQLRSDQEQAEAAAAFAAKAAALAEEERQLVEEERAAREAEIKRKYDVVKRAAEGKAAEEEATRAEEAQRAAEDTAAAEERAAAEEEERKKREATMGSAGAFDRYREGALLASGLTQQDFDDLHELI